MRNLILATIFLLLVACGSAEQPPASGTSEAVAAVTATALAAPSASVSAAPVASASSSASDEQPSSGKEMPKGQPGPTEDESVKIWTAAVELGGSSKLKCKDVVNAKTRYALSKAQPDPAVVKTKMRSYLRIARCAESLRWYGYLMEIGRVMVKADPVDGHPEVIARAYLGKRAYTSALSVLTAASKKDPDDANVAMTFAKVYCTMARWTECKTSSQQAIALVPKEELADEQRRLEAGANKYLAKAQARSGDFDGASKSLEAAEKLNGKKSDIEDIRAEIAMGRTHAAIIDVDADDEILLGVYHLVGKVPNLAPLVRLNLSNLEDTDAEFRVQVEIPGVTQVATERVVVGKKGNKSLDVTPPLRGDFEIDKIRSPDASGISVKIMKKKKTGDELVVEQTYKTTLDPRDYLPMYTYADDSKSATIRDSRFIGAWVTPNDKSVDAFLKDAKKKLKKGSFVGEQGPTLVQVEALFEELRAKGVSYVMDPEALSSDVRSQRTRLPAEVLTSTNAQCLEGAILYATLLEAIKLKPLIILVPGHAFVAWRPSPKDNTQEKLYFLETTMTGGKSPFEKVVARGKEQFDEHDSKKKASLIDLAQLRKDGILPQPAQRKLASP